MIIGCARQSSSKLDFALTGTIIAKSFWANIFKAEGITNRIKQQECVNREKDNIISFLTGMENSGKVLFSEFYVSPNGEEQHDVVINKVETGAEGGDCFAIVGCAHQGCACALHAIKQNATRTHACQHHVQRKQGRFGRLRVESLKITVWTKRIDC